MTKMRRRSFVSFQLKSLLFSIPLIKLVIKKRNRLCYAKGSFSENIQICRDIYVDVYVEDM